MEWVQWYGYYVKRTALALKIFIYWTINMKLFLNIEAYLMTFESVWLKENLGTTCHIICFWGKWSVARAVDFNQGERAYDVFSGDVSMQDSSAHRHEKETCHNRINKTGGWIYFSSFLTKYIYINGNNLIQNMLTLLVKVSLKHKWVFLITVHPTPIFLSVFVCLSIRLSVCPSVCKLITFSNSSPDLLGQF